MEYQEYADKLKNIPASGLYYFGMDHNENLYDLFKDYIEYLLINSDIWIDEIKDVNIDEDENKLFITIEYTFDGMVDLFDEGDKKLSSSIKLEFDDSYYNDIHYEHMDLKELAENIVDMFATHVEEKINEETELKREEILEIEKEDEYQERYGIDERE